MNDDQSIENDVRTRLQHLATAAPQNPHRAADVVALVASENSGRSGARRAGRAGRWAWPAAAASGVAVAATVAVVAVVGATTGGDTQPSPPAAADKPSVPATATTSSEPAEVNTAATAAPFPARIATSDFPVNSHGLTYGSDAKVVDLDNGLPDLIAVAGDNGVSGFVYREDLHPSSGQIEHTLDVYDTEGQVVVGTLTTMTTFEVPQAP